MSGYNHDLYLALHRAADMLQFPNLYTQKERDAVVSELRGEARNLYNSRKAPLGELLDGQ